MFFVTSKEEHSCPICGKRLVVHDYVKRHVVEKETGDKVWYCVRRLRCKGCKKCHRELPDFMLPYKHYELETVQEALDGPANLSCSAESSTVRHWQKVYAGAKDYINGALASLRFKKTGKLPKLFTTTSLLDYIRKRFRHWLTYVTKRLVNTGLGIPT